MGHLYHGYVTVITSGYSHASGNSALKVQVLPGNPGPVPWGEQNHTKNAKLVYPISQKETGAKKKHIETELSNKLSNRV